MPFKATVSKLLEINVLLLLTLGSPSPRIGRRSNYEKKLYRCSMGHRTMYDSHALGCRAGKRGCTPVCLEGTAEHSLHLLPWKQKHFR